MAKPVRWRRLREDCLSHRGLRRRGGRIARRLLRLAHARSDQGMTRLDVLRLAGERLAHILSGGRRVSKAPERRITADRAAHLDHLDNMTHRWALLRLMLKANLRTAGSSEGECKRHAKRARASRLDDSAQRLQLAVQIDLWPLPLYHCECSLQRASAFEGDRTVRHLPQEHPCVEVVRLKQRRGKMVDGRLRAYHTSAHRT